MLYNENLREEEQHLIQQIAEQTERGKIDWELTEYNPLSFLNEDKIDKNPAVICQSFSFEAIIGGSRYELDVMENIDVPSGRLLHLLLRLLDLLNELVQRLFQHLG